MAKEDKKYQQIIEKLGFELSEYQLPDATTEDDNRINPFSVLSLEEMEYLYDNGYLPV